MSLPEDVCIICTQKSKEDDDCLLSPKNYESWQTLLNAASVRQHGPILDIAQKLGDNEIPKLAYHRKCRSIFTMKRDLDSLKRKTSEESVTRERKASESEDEVPAKRLCKRVSSVARVYDSVCIFCNKDKFQKGTRTCEKLTQAMQLRVDQTLRDCAVRKGDDKILALTSRDIVAAEAHYHRSCYRNYTRSMYEHEGTSGSCSLYQEIERESYAKLMNHIKTDIIPNKKVVQIASLSAMLESFMLASDIDQVYDSTKKHFHRKLASDLEGEVEIFPDDKGKLLMIPNTISLQDIVIENQILKRELEICKGKITGSDKIIDQTASKIRMAIKQFQATTPNPWPYHPANLENFSIPAQLERFLVCLLTGDPDSKNNQTHRVTTLISSFSQDMVYAVTCGKHKPPKHILLPYAVKTLTGNVELIRTLNKFGHGVSYSQLEENDTALCLQKLATELNHRVTLPRSIKPYIFTTLGWDNIDRLEETLTGEGTSHRVNGIIVQAKIYGPDMPSPELPCIEKKKQRSVNADSQQLEVYMSGTRVGPQPLPTKEDNIKEAEEASTNACQKNFVWILARLNQAVPSWTGFNIITRNEIQVSEDIVGYLPTINAPATELNTVFEILKQSELIRRNLYLDAIVVVMDQALFAKAAEIVWREKDKFSHILLRMGAFHTICNALSIISKRFQDAGLKDICIEAGIVAQGSIRGVLEGKHYNRAIRVHKCIYEALMRLAWREFILWANDDNEISSTITAFLELVDTMAGDLNQQSFNSLLQNPLFFKLMAFWNNFLEHLRYTNGDLSSFWMSYLDMVESILLGLLRASREGSWDLHLNAIRTMIPWCFAYDKVNYARYLSAYYAQMTNIPELYPFVYEAFKNGQFSVQLSSSNPFGRIPVDQTTEVTVNKDTQTPGGTCRFSLKAGAIKRYYITAEYRSGFLKQLRSMVQGGTFGIHHADLQPSRIKKR